MALWTDVIDPATLTGYARAALEDLESQGTLAQFLPNSVVADTAVRFVIGEHGLIETAKYRAFDAEPEVGRGRKGRRVSIELPAISQEIPVSEYQQLRMKNADNDAMLPSIQKTTNIVVRAIADGIERTRGVVLSTGKATIDQDNFQSEDDFGRPAEHSVTAPTAWNAAGSDPLRDLLVWKQVYSDTNGEDPGALVLSSQILSVLANHEQFRVKLENNAYRPATVSDVKNILEASGLPPVVVYDRKVGVNGAKVRVTPANMLLMLPSPVDPSAPDDTDLGGTFWGETLTSTDPDYALATADQPGLVTGVYRNPKPPMIAEVVGDAIALPVLANAALSLAATVL